VSRPAEQPHVLQFRPLGVADQDKLWHWLHVALWDPPPAGLRPIEVLQAPGVRIYAEHWGQPSDVGVVAQVSGTDAGACWMRLLPVGVGLASVDAATPQLGIALEPQFQHKGYGRPLIQQTLNAAAQAGFRQVSLTVHPDNPAQYLYERCGFRKVERRNTYHLMVADVAGGGLELHRSETPWRQPF
jgi:ribosomal protein S18 acetylase RimI-like enzyme